MPSPDDTIGSGRQERFLSLYDPLHDRLARFARALARDRDEARDLVGETILVAYEQFDSLRDQKAFLGYLFTIAHRTWKRGVGRRNIFGGDDRNLVDHVPSHTASPETSADIQILYDTLALLPARQREAVALFELSGLTLEEIRTIQGGTLSGVKARVVRGRRKLAELLRDGATDDRPTLPAQPLVATGTTASSPSDPIAELTILHSQTR